MTSPVKKLFLIFVLSLIAGYICLPINHYPRKFDLKLGLDLAGGSRLVFEADTSKIDETKKEQALMSLKDIIEKRVNLFGLSESSVQTSVFEDKNRITVELPGINDPKSAASSIGQTAQLNFFEVIDASPSASLVPIGITGADLLSASVVFDQNTGKPSVSFEVVKESQDKFAQVTKKLIGKRMVILIDQSVVTDAVVQDVLSTNGQITGNFTIEEANEMSALLNSGALPVPVSLVEERTVGATLGVDSIKQSMIAGLVGIGMVVLFMVMTYKGLGIIAAVGLLVFSLITLALYKLIPITLTLPGIAGFMLSIGMAVDSNILIFERLKEEIKKRSMTDALEISFGRAWDSIRDANIATLVTAFILANPLDFKFLHVSGPVRGFAITLALGIAISLFTGIFVSRNLMRVFVKERMYK